MKAKKILSLVLATLLLIGVLAACTSSTTPGSDNPGSEAPSNTPTGTPDSNTPDGETAPGIEGWTAFDNNVTITVPVYDRSKEGYPAVDDNYWTKWVQSEFGDKYNVTVKYVPIPRSDVMTAYSLLIVGGDTPTIMMEYDYPKVAEWADQGAMGTYDIDAFKQVAPNYYQSMVDNDQLGYTDLNGETYFVLSERPYYKTTFTFATWVRMDWLRQVGYDSVPKSYAEKKDAMEKIVAAGLSDSPLPMGIPASAYVNNFPYRDFPVNEAEWAQHSSLGTPSLSWEPTKRMLKRYNDEFHAGFYSSEFDLREDSRGQAGGEIEAEFINGKIYSYGSYISNNMAWLSAFYAENPGAELAVESVYTGVEPGVQDTAAIRADNPFGMIVGFSSKATDDQLKAAWMLMEWMLQDDVLFEMENGYENVTFVYDSMGFPVVDPDYRGTEMLNHNMNIDMTCLVHASKKVGTVEETIKLMAPAGLPQDFSQELINNYYDLQAVADKGWAYTDPIFAEIVAVEAEYNATLLANYKEAFAALVKCDPAEFDALYDRLSADYLAAGYQEIIDARLEVYNRGMTTKLPK